MTATTYARAEIVALYDRQRGLQPPEQLLFDTHLTPGMRILDVGVGGGRTTPHLSALAGRYVGIDYSEPMVRLCRDRFPGLRFVRMDAAEMAGFADGSFDAVVFSFNGLDALPTRAARARCFTECARVLRDGGVFVFSSHNPAHLLFRPVLSGVGPLRAIFRILYACAHTAANLFLRLPRAAFWKGYGQLWDFATDGGLTIHVASPRRIVAEAAKSGLAVVEVVPSSYPRPAWRVATAWYYYACIKSRRP